MLTVSEALDLARIGNREAAANALKQEFQRLQSPDQKVELCEWIASCFEKLNDYEREQIVQALATTKGNQTQAAALLGMSRRALINRIEAYGLPRPRKPG